MIFTVPQNAIAGTTTADFLKWERKAQRAFVHTSITMIGVVSSQIKPKTARCIDKWYFQNKEIRKERDKEILTGMQEYKKYHPSAVILAYVERACGKFK